MESSQSWCRWWSLIIIPDQLMPNMNFKIFRDKNNCQKNSVTYMLQKIQEKCKRDHKRVQHHVLYSAATKKGSQWCWSWRLAENHWRASAVPKTICAQQFTPLNTHKILLRLSIFLKKNSTIASNISTLLVLQAVSLRKKTKVFVGTCQFNSYFIRNLIMYWNYRSRKIQYIANFFHGVSSTIFPGRQSEVTMIAFFLHYEISNVSSNDLLIFIAPIWSRHCLLCFITNNYQICKYVWKHRREICYGGRGYNCFNYIFSSVL